MFFLSNRLEALPWSHCLNRRSVRSPLSVAICLALLLSSLVLGLPKPAPVAAQGRNNDATDNSRQVEPPRPVSGPLGAELPNTALLLGRPRQSAPQIQPSTISTQPRYRHPRLGPRGAALGQFRTVTSVAQNHAGMKWSEAAKLLDEKPVTSHDADVLPKIKGALRPSLSSARTSAAGLPAIERSHVNVRHPLMPQNPFDFPAAMLDPHNRIGGGGEDLFSQNYNWALGILSLAGRAGLDLGLSLSYNSLATWTRSGSYIDFDYDNGFPTPGFRLSFPVVDGYLYYNTQAGAYYYLLFTSSGARVELRRVAGSSNVYEAVDSSYLQLTDNGSYLLEVSYWQYSSQVPRATW